MGSWVHARQHEDVQATKLVMVGTAGTISHTSACLGPCLGARLRSALTVLSVFQTDPPRLESLASGHTVVRSVTCLLKPVSIVTYKYGLRRGQEKGDKEEIEKQKYPESRV